MAVRRRTPDGRALHCCCVCGLLAPWGPGWAWYGSERQAEDGEAVAKFCPDHAAGAQRRPFGRPDIPQDAIVAARESEYRYG